MLVAKNCFNGVTIFEVLQWYAWTHKGSLGVENWSIFYSCHVFQPSYLAREDRNSLLYK